MRCDRDRFALSSTVSGFQSRDVAVGGNALFSAIIPDAFFKRVQKTEIGWSEETRTVVCLGLSACVLLASIELGRLGETAENLSFPEVASASVTHERNFFPM